MMTDSIAVRRAGAADIDAMQTFIFEHGPNQWNFLPPPEVNAHLAAIADSKVDAVIAEIDGRMAGFVTFMASRAMLRYQSPARLGRLHGYVCEAVVHRAYAGRGIGSRLLAAAAAELAARGFEEIYIERHEQNLASAGMMRKTGFVEIDCFDDPARRAVGSRRTTVCRLIVSPPPPAPLP